MRKYLKLICVVAGCLAPYAMADAREAKPDLSQVDAIDLILVPNDQESRVPIRPMDMLAGGKHHVLQGDRNPDRSFLEWIRSRVGEGVDHPSLQSQMNIHLALIAFAGGKPVYTLFSSGVPLYTDGTKGDPEGLVDGRRVSIDHTFIENLYARAEKAYPGDAYP
jgi:hypothetical protein